MKPEEPGQEADEKKRWPWDAKPWKKWTWGQHEEPWESSELRDPKAGQRRAASQEAHC